MVTQTVDMSLYEKIQIAKGFNFNLLVGLALLTFYQSGYNAVRDTRPLFSRPFVSAAEDFNKAS
jgi:hypothetical protein